MLRSLTSALRRHGPIRFCALVLRNVLYHLGTRRSRQLPDPEDLAFDRSHNVETASIREIGSLQIESPNERYAVRYQPSDRDLVRAALAELDVDCHRYTFVDYGCGKGLVLLVASSLPFKEIVGVEFAQELRDIAAANIASYADPARRCHRLSVVLADAADYEPPAGPLVCYFYNPFDAPVMRRVLQRLEARAATERQPVIVVYLNPRHKSLFDASGRWRVTVDADAYTIFTALVDG